MFYENLETGEKIEWDNMDFGTEKESKCGICGCNGEGHWKNGNLIEDIICENCENIWKFFEEEEI